MGQRFNRFIVGFLTLCACVRPALAAGPSPNPNETEEEQMVTQVEQMGKAIQQALSKIATQLKNGGGNAAAAKIDLEKLSADLTKTQAAVKKNLKNGESAAQGKATETTKTLQNFLQNFSSKMLDNVNDAVDKLEQMGDEGK